MDFAQAFLQIWNTTGIHMMVWQQGVMPLVVF